jgi:hypothetical protein
MKTTINTIHEEKISQGDMQRVIGMLLNYADENEEEEWKNTYPYVYNKGTYIFFITIMDTMNYLLYGEKDIKRAYLKEDEFDALYDQDSFEGKFEENVVWF